jgi:predicted O-methyltransferase YrrM
MTRTYVWGTKLWNKLRKTEGYEFGAEVSSVEDFDPGEHEYAISLVTNGSVDAQRAALLATSPGGEVENLGFHFADVPLRVAAMHSRRKISPILDTPADLWAAVDAYVTQHLIGEDPALDAVLAASKQAGLLGGPISAGQGRMLELLVRISGSRRVLEIGTLGGYSTIWLARGLPSGGHVLTLEVDAHHAEVAQANIARVGLADRIEVRVGAALATMQKLVAERSVPFDLIFIDADKQNNPGYLEWALKLSRAGTVIIADNVVRAGRILDLDASDPRLGDGGLDGLRGFYELLGAEPRITATVIQAVDAKGHDGFALGLVTSERQTIQPQEAWLS